MRGFLVLLAVLATLRAVEPAGAATYVVRPDGTGDFPTIQAAIVGASDGDVVELASGIYQGDGNRDIDLLHKSIRVRSQSGRPDLCIIDCEGSPTTPHRGFLIEVLPGSDAAVEGVTVLDGYADGAGGAVGCYDGSVSLDHCVFRNCHARTHGGCVSCGAACVYITACAFIEGGVEGVGEGGGLYAVGGATGLEDCLFERNSAREGGAVYVEWGSPWLTLQRCEFRGNAASFAGGAVRCMGESRTWMTSCTFAENTAGDPIGDGGAVDVGNSHSELTCDMERCTFFDNHAYAGGGGARGVRRRRRAVDQLHSVRQRGDRRGRHLGGA